MVCNAENVVNLTVQNLNDLGTKKKYKSIHLQFLSIHMLCQVFLQWV